MSDGKGKVIAAELHEKQKRDAIRRLLSLTPDEFNAWVTGIYGADNGYGYSVYFSANTPPSVREKVPGLKSQLFLHTGPIAVGKAE